MLTKACGETIRLSACLSTEQVSMKQEAQKLQLWVAHIPAMINEWERRGYNGPKCKEHLENLKEVLPYTESSNTPPSWITPELIRSHQSNLIRKDKEFYAEKFPGVRVPEDLEYIWPV